MLTPDELQEIRRLQEDRIPLRAIARRLGRSVKTIRRALGRASPAPTPSKLGPYQEIARTLHAERAHAPRILRELRERGYAGGLTILKDFLKTLEAPRPARRAFRRFETLPGVEAQSDWSPYRVLIAGVATVVHAFSLVLCFSRRLYIRLFRNERLPTLLWAHAEAFRYHGGLCARIAYDNQTAITLGRIGGKPLWHPTFLDFAKAYGFKPEVGRPKHKERRGKVERPFAYFEGDFLPARTFASWEDMNQQVAVWLDTVANIRMHGTTLRLVHEAYAEERPCLITLPEIPYTPERRETRKVQKDAYVPIDGTFYPVPPALVGQWVTVRIGPTRVEILDAAGKVAAGHAVPDRPTRLPSSVPLPGAPLAGVSQTLLETRFLACFPAARDFLEGLKRKMTTLTPIHLRVIERLTELYGEAAVRAALERALVYRNFNACALRRVLEREHPQVIPEPAIPPLSTRPDALGALDEIEPVSPDDYTLDSQKPTDGADHES